jgi:microcystin-dependent protein
MLVTNTTNQDYFFGPLHLAAGIGQTLTVDDTTATSLYLTEDSVADAINNLSINGKITVTGAAPPFPRPTGVPQILHGDGTPEGLVFAPQGSLYMRRDNSGSSSSLYAKTTGITVDTGWQAVAADVLAAPTGTIHLFAPTVVPTGWLPCDGAAVSRSTYTGLFAAITTTYGAGDGSTTFNVPDLRGRVPVGFAAAGGHADVSTVGSNDGTVIANRRPKHKHTPHSHSFTAVQVYLPHDAAAGSAVSGYDATSGTTGTADGGSGNTNDSLDAPAYLVVNYIIKT